MSPCVPAESLVELVNGRLSGSELEQVEAHLDECSECRAGAAVAARPDSWSPSPITEALTFLSPGACVGRYEVLAVAGIGGMGVVYSAYDPTLHRKVALKLVRPDRLGDGTLVAARLLAEAKVMAKVTHAEVLPIFDAGTFDEQVFIAMEWVEGRTLRNWLHTPRPWKDTIEFFMRAGRGLQAAHAAGVVHRDFKPENVLIGDDGRVRVSDFGLALETSVVNAQSPSVAGTLTYMAPEVARGEPATSRADQFSFCAALYEALGGRLPIQAPRASLSGPRWLTRTVLKGLSAEPVDRFADMAELLRALDRHNRAPRYWAMAASALLLLLLLGGVQLKRSFDERTCAGGPASFSAVWNPQRRSALVDSAPATERDTAVRIANVLDGFETHWLQAHRVACEATHVRGEQSERLLDLKMACLRRGLVGAQALLSALEQAPSMSYLKALDTAFELRATSACADENYLTAQNSGLKPENTAEANRLRETLARNRVMLGMGSFEAGRAATEPVVVLARTLGLRAVEGEAQLLMVQFLRKLRSKPQATPASDQLLEEATLLGIEAQYPHLVAEAWLTRMGVNMDDGRHDEADKSERMAAAYGRTLGDAPVFEGRHNLRLGMLRMRQGNPLAALEAYANAQRVLPRLPEAEAALLLTDLLGSEAIALVGLGRVREAAQKLEQSIAQVEQRYGPLHPSLGEHHHNLAEIRLNQGKPEDCLKELEASQKAWAKAFGERNPRSGVNGVLKAHCLVVLGQTDNALRTVESTKALFRENHLETSFMFMRALCAEGVIRAAMNDLAGSELAHKHALALAPEAKGKYPFDEADCQTSWGETLARQGQLVASREAFDRAIELFQSNHGSLARSARATIGRAELNATESTKEVVEQTLTDLGREGLEPKLCLRAVTVLGRLTKP